MRYLLNSLLLLILLAVAIAVEKDNSLKMRKRLNYEVAKEAANNAAAAMLSPRSKLVPRRMIEKPRAKG
jgi:hypothetical protein